MFFCEIMEKPGAFVVEFLPGAVGCFCDGGCPSGLADDFYAQMINSQERTTSFPKIWYGVTGITDLPLCRMPLRQERTFRFSG